MLLGLKIGGSAGLVIGGGFVAAQIFGFPETEIGEGAGAVAVAGYRAWQFLSTIGAEQGNTIAGGALLGGSLFGGLGMITGLAATAPTCGGGSAP
jgi:hypothetical protein